MKRSILIQSIVAISTGILLTACSATSTDDKAKQLEKLKKEQAEIASKIAALESEMPVDSTMSVKAKEVDVLVVSGQKFDHYIQTQGLVEAEDNILVSAKSMGVVMQVFTNEGQFVAKGQVLAQIDNSLILRNIEGMKAQLELAVSVYNRQKNLWDQKIGTEVQFLQAKTNKESLEKQLAALQEQNDMTRIKSPIQGTVDEVMVKIGENISPGQPAVRVVNTSNLKLVAAVSEAYVTNIRQGNKVVVSIPELKKDISAAVTFVGKTIDPMSRTFAVEVKLPNEPNLRPNMSAVVRVVYRTELSAIVVPVNVVQEINGEKIVYIAEQKGKSLVARKKVVGVEGVFGNYAQVNGLNAGDQVITVGYQSLSDGEFVKI
jgi:membrane fusion protein (multidrug efflux system)